MVAGPILLVYALEHGRLFAANAAAGTLLGLVSLIAFVVVYGRLAARPSWGICLLAGWLAFALGTVVFYEALIPIGAAVALVGVAILLGLALLPRPGSESRAYPNAPPWDLPMRAACALALVLTLTAVAGWLGPHLSGLLTPFPVMATILATFTHAQRGTDELLRLLRGLISGFGAFALFCFTLSISLRTLDIASAFALATALALLTQSATLALTRGEPASEAPPASDALPEY